MAGSSMSSRPGAIIEGINVTPLVDIMLVLLVIFIVTAKLLVTQAIPMDLPTAARTEELQVVFAVSVPSTGPTRVNGQAVADEATLEGQARAALKQDPELRAVIQADGAVAHRRVIQTLDTLRKAGMSRVAFATVPAENLPAAPLPSVTGAQ
jgi:biopolymer transport protein TolR